ncbi:hypothetical protein HK103_006139 [Boothiomyces macroporosus]|uniref:Alpha/beta hydrolase fold-3 domain-containing protein n=1 Tax=Boothiomyces macroporosus TaxID=261099 RepID=A0AAD5Y2W2_9FUNG|nr:hypothetical protein HK103_006139 [Boothiomyces macroporosus]
MADYRIKLNTSLMRSKHIEKVLEFDAIHHDQPLDSNTKSLGRKHITERSLSETSLKPKQITTTVGTKGLKTLLHTFKDKITWGHLLTKGRKATAPVPLSAKVTKISIARRDNIKIESCSKLDNSGTFNAEWIDYKEEIPKERVILYIHGGAFVFASRRTHRSITWRLSKYAEAKVLSVDYRLAPHSTFPAPLIDVLSAYQYLIDPPSPDMVKYKPEQITFVGDSAGGCLAIACMLYCRDSGTLPVPGAVATIAPYADLSHSLPAWQINQLYDYLPHGADDPKFISESRTNVYLAHDSDMNNPYASPILAAETDVSLPPMLIQVGGAERVRDDGIYLSEVTFKNSPIRLEIYEESVHVFQMFAPVDKFSRVALERMGSFVKAQTGASASYPPLERESLRILNAPGFPVQEIHDAMGIIEDGIKVCVEKGVWESELKDGVLNVTLK